MERRAGALMESFAYDSMREESQLAYEKEMK